MDESLTSPAYENLQPFTPGPNAVDLTPENDGGVLKEIKQEGRGNQKPCPQDRVEVHYVGYFPDGTVFDSSRDRRNKFEFTLGRGEVIKAWDLGVSSMRQGEVAILYCKPEYAYGEHGHPPKIPPNSTLVFEIELFDWKGEDLTEAKDGGIIRNQLVKGNGFLSPKEGSLVEVNLIGRYEGKVFEERDVTFTLGEGTDQGVPEGIEKGLEHFSKGEKSILTLSPDYAFGKQGNSDLGIPPSSLVRYEVTLNTFEKTKESWNMDTKEKIEQSNMCKNKGTDYFKAEKYSLAIKQYKRIIDYLQHEKNPNDTELENECKQLMLAGYLNIAMCHLKLGESLDAKEFCCKALEIEAQNEKGLFRRGQAYFAMNDFELALKDFKTVLSIDSANKAAANQILLCNNKIKQQKEKEKQIYGNMFAKFAAQDDSREQQRWMNLPDVMENPGTWPASHPNHRNHLNLLSENIDIINDGQGMQREVD